MNDLTHSTFGGGSPLTMSSREIAELCETRHNQVVETIERLFEKGVLRESRKTTRAYYPEGGGRPTQVYDLTKRDTLVVASGYNDELRARIIDRWQELEVGTQIRAPRIDKAREHRLTMTHNLRLAKMIGLEGNQAAMSANRATAAITGIDTLALMGVSHMKAPSNDALLTPTELGRRAEIGSGRAVNARLCLLGLQRAYRDGKGHPYYEPTEAGIAAGAVMQDTGKRHGDGTPIRQLKWSNSVLSLLKPDEDAA